jgi:hypothetical protein
MPEPTTTPPTAPPAFDRLERDLLRIRGAIPQLIHTVNSLQYHDQAAKHPAAGEHLRHDGSHNLVSQTAAFADLVEGELARLGGVQQQCHAQKYR